MLKFLDFTCCLKLNKLFLDEAAVVVMVCGGDEFCDGIGGGCSCGGGGNISDQFGTKRWLF